MKSAFSKYRECDQALFIGNLHDNLMCIFMSIILTSIGKGLKLEEFSKVLKVRHLLKGRKLLDTRSV